MSLMIAISFYVSVRDTYFCTDSSSFSPFFTHAYSYKIINAYLEGGLRETKFIHTVVVVVIAVP